MMLRSFVVTFFSLIISVSVFAAQNPTQALDRVVAVVNDQVITQNQLDNAIRDLTKALQANGESVPNQAKLKTDALNQLIANSLQLQLAHSNKIEISDQELTKTITNIAEKNHLTLAQLKEELSKQGMNFNRFRAQLKEQMTIHEVQRNALGGKIKVTDDEVRAYIKSGAAQNNPNLQYRLDDLLIPLDDASSAETIANAQKQAQELLQKAKQGISLSELANGANPPLHYTDLGWRRIAELPSLFAEAVVNMKTGAVKGPIKAPNGLHLIKLIELQGQKTLTEEEAKNFLFQKKLKEQLDAWLQQIRKSAYVKIM